MNREDKRTFAIDACGLRNITSDNCFLLSPIIFLKGSRTELLVEVLEHPDLPTIDDGVDESTAAVELAADVDDLVEDFWPCRILALYIF